MNNLRKARQAKGLKLAEAARKLGMTAATLRGLEDGAFRPREAERVALGLMYGEHLAGQGQDPFEASSHHQAEDAKRERGDTNQP